MQPNFWADSKNFDKAQNILRPVKGQGITLLQEDLEASKISIPFFYSKYKSQCYQDFKQTAKRSIAAFKEFKLKIGVQKITSIHAKPNFSQLRCLLTLIYLSVFMFLAFSSRSSWASWGAE